MAERDSLSTVADGDQLNEGYFNDIKNKLTTRRNLSGEDTSEYSVAAGNSYTDIGYSKTFTVPDSITASRIVGFYVKADVKSSSATQDVYYRFKLTNDTNSQAFYFYNTYFTQGTSSTVFQTVMRAQTTSYVENIDYIRPFDGRVAGNNSVDSGNYLALEKGVTYTLTIEVIKEDTDDTSTGYIKNITVGLDWNSIGIEETSGWA